LLADQPACVAYNPDAPQPRGFVFSRYIPADGLDAARTGGR